MYRQNNNNDSVGGYMPPAESTGATAAAGAAEAPQDYYYYYEMPDGSIGYMTAEGYNQTYSPVDDQQEANQAVEDAPQPAGYVEPTYGQGTAYAPPQQQQQQQYVMTSQMNNNYSGVPNANAVYYTYEAGNRAVGAGPSQTQMQQQQPVYQQQDFAPQATYAAPSPAQQMGEAGMMPAPQPKLPHAGGVNGWYVPPASFAEMRKWHGTQKWSTPLGRVCCTEPCYCLGACIAPWCVVAAHRRRLLQKDYTQYRCCAGVCGRVDHCECCGGTPRCSLFWEILFCLPCACHANRYMLMQRYGLRKSCWDTSILGLGCFCAPVHCCGECTRWFPESFWDWLYVVTYSCMLTQEHRELDAHEKAVV